MSAHVPYLGPQHSHRNFFGDFFTTSISAVRALFCFDLDRIVTLSTLSCAFNLTGRLSECLDRDWPVLTTNTSSTLAFLFLTPSFHLLDRPKNILYHSNDPDSVIVVVDFCMQVPIHFPPLTPLCSSFHREKFPHSTENNSPPSPTLLALSPQSHQKH